MAGGIIALDLATSCGFAIAGPDAVKAWPPGLPTARHPRPDSVQYGTKVLEGDLGGKLHRFRRWLRPLIAIQQPRLIVYEAPLPAGRQRSTDAAWLAFALSGMTEELAHEAARHFTCRAKHANNQSIKKDWAGTAHANKDQMVAVARRCGWCPDTHDAADALALMNYACQICMPELRRAA